MNWEQAWEDVQAALPSALAVLEPRQGALVDHWRFVLTAENYPPELRLDCVFICADRRRSACPTTRNIRHLRAEELQEAAQLAADIAAVTGFRALPPHWGVLTYHIRPYYERYEEQKCLRQGRRSS